MITSEHSIKRFIIINLLGGISLGYNQGSISTSQTPMCSVFDGCDTDTTIVLYTAFLLAGAMVGSSTGGFLCNKFGRKFTMALSNLITVIGVIMNTFCPNIFPILLAVRIILGFGIGVVGVVCPMYISEMAPENKRGLLNSIFQLAITIGIILSYASGLLYAIIGIDKNDLLWRIIVAPGCLPSLILMIIAIFHLPESIRFHEPNEPDSYAPIQTKCSSVIRAFALGAVLAAVLQLTGINAIMFFGIEILKSIPSVRENNIVLLLLNLAIGVWNSITTVIAIVLVEKVGRRKLMLFGSFLVTAANIVIGFGYVLFDSDDKQSILQVVILSGLAVYLLGFETGPGSLFWVLVNEIFPRKNKEAGATYCNVLQWLFNLAVTTSFVPLKNAISAPPIFFIFGVVGIITFIYMTVELKERKVMRV